MKVSSSDQTCALGAAILSAVASGHDTLENLQRNTVQYSDTVYQPIPEHQKIYQQLYVIYQTLHDAFGKTEWAGSLDHVMKDLINLREEQHTS